MLSSQPWATGAASIVPPHPDVGLQHLRIKAAIAVVKLDLPRPGASTRVKCSASWCPQRFGQRPYQVPPLWS